jgi:ElaB/YqjD/DUF883 family membrane-anchored ribosome-binding protein
MDQEPDVIRDQMEETRTSLTGKLESLERKVTDTVQGTATAVGDAVASVKDAVRQTLDSVRNVFDIQQQVDLHPWTMMAGSVAVGYLAGMLVPGGARKGRNGSIRPAEPAAVRNGEVPRFESPAASSVAPAIPSGSASVLNEWGEKFKDEISELKSLAVGTTLGIIRDMVMPSVPPETKPQIKELIDGITTKLGGKPYQGPVLPKKSSTRDYAGQAAGSPFV